MLTLNRRSCTLGCDYSGKVTYEDGQNIRTLVFELDGVLLDDRELNALLCDPHAHDALYVTTPEGAVMPFLKCFKSLEFDKPIEVANVRVWFGLESSQEFCNVTLTKIKLSLHDGGATGFSCKVRTAPTLDETLAELFEQFGKPIEAQVTLVPPGSQQEFPLNTHAIGEQPLERKPPKRASRGRGKGREGAILQ